MTRSEYEIMLEKLDKRRLESFTLLPSLPKVQNLEQGRKLLQQLQHRGSDSARAWLSIILRGLRLPDRGRVLEVGPGCCNYALELTARGFDYHGYDMVEQNVALWEVLREQYLLPETVILRDICTVDPARNEETFDGIFAISTFEHIHDQDAALENCYRLLRKRGRLVIIDGNMLYFGMFLEMLRRRRSAGLLWPFRKGTILDNYGMGWKGKDEDVKSIFWWRRHLKRQGFSVITVSTTTARRPLARMLGVWPFLGDVVAVAERPVIRRAGRL
jgi:SAM-dependent methyltransferase